eukprot:1724461-Rhodomonas_salina.3
MRKHSTENGQSRRWSGTPSSSSRLTLARRSSSCGRSRSSKRKTTILRRGCSACHVPSFIVYHSPGTNTGVPAPRLWRKTEEALTLRKQASCCSMRTSGSAHGALHCAVLIERMVLLQVQEQLKFIRELSQVPPFRVLHCQFKTPEKNTQSPNTLYQKSVFLYSISAGSACISSSLAYAMRKHGLGRARDATVYDSKPDDS